MFEAFLKIGKWLFIVAWLVIVIAFFGGNSIMTFLFHDLPFMGTSFSHTEWIQAGKCNETSCKQNVECTRGGMFRDLQKNHLPVGLSRSEVELKIGNGSYDQQRNCVSYPLGMCSGLGIDLDSLNVCYNNENRVLSVTHFQN